MYVTPERGGCGGCVNNKDKVLIFCPKNLLTSEERRDTDLRDYKESNE